MRHFRWYILPRFLKDVSNRSLKCSIFGMDLNTPIGFAPTAVQKMVDHDGGECAAVKGIQWQIFRACSIDSYPKKIISLASSNSLNVAFRNRTYSQWGSLRRKSSNFNYPALLFPRGVGARCANSPLWKVRSVFVGRRRGRLRRSSLRMTFKAKKTMKVPIIKIWK